MPETRAYKLNELKQPAATEGMFLYYFYDKGKLTSVEVDEHQFDRLVELDTEMYNSDRVEKAHKATYVKADGKSYYKKIDMENDDGTLLDEKQRGMLEDVTEQATADKRLSALSEEDREIYRHYFLEEYTQAEIAEEIGKTQSYVAKHLAKIEDALSGSSESDEARANAQWEKFLDKFRTDDDEDILWDMFRVIMPVDDQAEIVSWFYSYREYYKFGLSYLVIRPFSKYKDDTIAELEFGNRLNELPHHSREIYYDIFDGQIDELRWLFLALCEEVEYRKKMMKEKPKQTNFEKIFEEAAKACSRLDMTAEEFIHKRFLPQQYARLEKRYTDFRRKYKNVVVIEEDDPRSIREQIIDIFGEGPVPHFSNPEFRKKK
jgi:RNA polymerase sigma factor (sigma-70 family)